MNLFILFNILILISLSSVYDIKYRRIPNFLTYPAVLIGLTCHSYISGFNGLRFSLLGIFTGTGLLIFPYLLGKMGAGDAKLLGAVGSFIGAKGIFILFLFTAIAGGIYALLIIILYKSKNNGILKNFYYNCVNYVVTRKFVSFENAEDVRQRPKLCYGLAIAAGTGIFIIFEVAGIKVLLL
jgi:prepilin peptidase CpaA